MMPIVAKNILMLGVAAGPVMGLATSATATCRAVCMDLECRWLAPAQVDVKEAALDAYLHWAHHSVRVDGLPGGLPTPRPLATAADLRCRARCTGNSWAGPVSCSWVGLERRDVTAGLSDLIDHQSTFEHVATIEYLPPRPGGVEGEDVSLAQVRVESYEWSGFAIIKWPGRTLGNERSEVIHGSGTTTARSEEEARAFGLNKFRHGQLRGYEERAPRSTGVT